MFARGWGKHNWRNIAPMFGYRLQQKCLLTVLALKRPPLLLYRVDKVLALKRPLYLLYRVDKVLASSLFFSRHNVNSIRINSV